MNTQETVSPQDRFYTKNFLNGLLQIAIYTQENRQKICGILDGEEGEESYEINDPITPEIIQKELARYYSLLEIAKSLRSEQFKVTAQAVDEELEIKRYLQFVPPDLQEIIVKICQVIVNIYRAIQLKPSISIKTTQERLNVIQLQISTILKQGIEEIDKQKATYESIQSKNLDPQLTELVKVMGEIICILNNTVQSMDNFIQSTLEAVKSLE